MNCRVADAEAREHHAREVARRVRDHAVESARRFEARDHLGRQFVERTRKVIDAGHEIVVEMRDDFFTVHA